eukprot:752064-Amorphochlora_amoeboformis.AAC.1
MKVLRFASMVNPEFLLAIPAQPETYGWAKSGSKCGSTQAHCCHRTKVKKAHRERNEEGAVNLGSLAGLNPRLEDYQVR